MFSNNSVQNQIERLQGSGKQAPLRKPGDGYTFAGAWLGIVAGIIIAGIILPMPWVFIVSAIGGGIAGTLLGSIVGTLTTKYRDSRNNPKHY